MDLTQPYQRKSEVRLNQRYHRKIEVRLNYKILTYVTSLYIIFEKRTNSLILQVFT